MKRKIFISLYNSRRMIVVSTIINSTV